MKTAHGRVLANHSSVSNGAWPITSLRGLWQMTTWLSPAHHYWTTICLLSIHMHTVTHHSESLFPGLLVFPWCLRVWLWLRRCVCIPRTSAATFLLKNDSQISPPFLITSHTGWLVSLRKPTHTHIHTYRLTTNSHTPPRWLKVED